MTGILEKLSLYVRGEVHAALDAQMGPEQLAQAIRDARSKLEDIENELASHEGGESILKEDIAKLTVGIATTQENIDLLLGDDDDSNDTQAIKLQENLTDKQAEIDKKNEDLATTRMLIETITAAQAAIQAKITEYEGHLSTLQLAERSATVKNKAAETLERVTSIVGDGNDISFGAIEQKIRQDAATADAKLRRSMGKVAQPERSIATAQATAAIARRKAELQAAKSTDKAA